MGGSPFPSAFAGAVGGEYGVGVGEGDPSPVFDDIRDPGRFSVGRSSGVGVEDGGGVGEGDCAMAVATKNGNTMNDNKVRMNSIRISKLLLTLYREDRISAGKRDSCSGSGAVLISSPHGPDGSNKARTELWPRQPRNIFRRAKAQSARHVAHVRAVHVCRVHHGNSAHPGAYASALYAWHGVCWKPSTTSHRPPELLQQANDLAKLGLRVADYVINQKGTLDPGELTAGLLLVLLPGMVFAYGLWFAMLAMFRHGGVGGTLASMNAREPNQADLKELQLADAAQEMAIAAGLPAPKIMLVDSSGANAAAVGTSPHDARIVISRRLLDDLDRDQLQAILAHLVGSIGNGDLGIAFTVTSVFETSGLLINIINAPFGKESRIQLWRVARYMLGGGTPEKRAADAAEIAEALAISVDGDTPDMDQYFKKGNPGLIKKAYRLVMFPLMFTNMAIRLTLWMFLNVLLGPSMAMLWRTRRYLADASSVELTRNPDALARALQCLSEDDTAFDSGDWATHLFVVNPKGDSGLRGQQPSQQQMAKAIQAWASTAHMMSAQDAANLYDVPVAAVALLGLLRKIGPECARK